MIFLSKRCFALCLALLTIAPGALGQAYPSKPVKIITLTAAGGSLDILARVLAQKLSEQTGQQFYVENRLGAGGNIGAAEVARSSPEGYTIGMITIATHGINPALYGRNMPFNPLEDFAPIALAAELKNVVVVNPGVPAKNIPELVAYARANPGKLNFGSAGTGTSQHLAGEMMKMIAHIDMTHIPYKGAAQAVPNLISGEIQLMFSSIPDVLPFIQDGKLRVIGVTSKERSQAVPDAVPVSEQGYPDFEVKAWFGMAGPKGLPTDVVEKLNRGIVAALAQPEVKQRLAGMGMDPPAANLSPDQFREFIRGEIAKWGAVVAASGAKAD